MRAFADPSLVLSRTRIVERFLGYVRFDTQSDETSDTCRARPSSWSWRPAGGRAEGAGAPGRGEAEVTMDQNGYVLAELPGTAPGRVGLCAHLDTAPAFTGAGVSPRLVEHYDGGAIDVGHGIVLDPPTRPS